MSASGPSDRWLDALQDQLCYQFDDVGLLREALVHRSQLNGSSDPSLRSNERLEHLGDAALEAFITLRLFIAFPDAAEGWLTAARSSLVRNETLARSHESCDWAMVCRWTAASRATAVATTITS